MSSVPNNTPAEKHRYKITADGCPLSNLSSLATNLTQYAVTL